MPLYGGDIKAQTVGTWPDASGAATASLTGSSSALAIGVPFTMTPTPSILEAWAQVRYCKPPLAAEAMGLVVTLYDCSTSAAGSGSGSPGGGGGDIGPIDPNAPPVEVPLPNYGYLTSVPQINVTYTSGPLMGTLPLLAAANGGSNPLIYGRLEEPALIIPGSGVVIPTTFKPRIIVLPTGKTGINIANPRAALDVISTGSKTTATAIFGVNSSHFLLANNPANTLGTNMRYSRHIAIFNNLPESKYNGIVQAGDQALIFTDGAGADGANINGSLVIAPWSNAASGLRMDNGGNIELNNNLIVKGAFTLADGFVNSNLEVRGSIKCNGFVAKPKWWPDYVFEKSYNLITLDSISNFIVKNKHLPGIPEADWVIENGQNIGELQIKQQEKIEELYLYIIRQNQILNKIQSTILDQQKAIELLLKK